MDGTERQAEAAATAQRTSTRRLLSRAGILGAGVAALRVAIAGAAGSRGPAHAPLVSERDRVAHLLRRAGFGYSADDLDAYTKLGVGGAVEVLVNYEQVPDDLEQRLQRSTFDMTKLAEMQRWWLMRMIYTRRPLQEKMVLFWHGHLVSGTGKVGLPMPKPEAPNPPNLMLDQNGYFRDHAMDTFGDLLKGISRDPAMVTYLDSRDNRKGKPNENYARELMELFTLGVAGPDGKPSFTETDVREVARAFTGWNLDASRTFLFRQNQFDGGQKTIFGKTGAFGGDEVIDLILAHPACAPYICRRLFSFFAYDDPEPSVLGPIVDAFRSSGGSVRAVVRAVLTSRAFFSDRAYRAKAKSPAEYIAGIARALKLDTDATGFQSGVQRMGQTLFNPPNVAGWPGGTAWFNTTSWLERVNQVNKILGIRKDDHTQPVDLLGTVQREALDSPERAVDYVLGLLVDGQVRGEQRQALIDYVEEGNLWRGRPAKETDPAVDRKLRGLIYLVMSMPEYQLA